MAGLMAGVAGLYLGVIALIAYAMVRPARWDGAGKLGVWALVAPLHLLALTALAVVLGAVAALAGAALAVVLCGVAAVASLAMAIVPVAAVGRVARRRGVRLSLRSYLTHAARPNWGGAEPDRSVVFATFADGAELRLDIWRPGDAASTSAPAVVRVHGGGWIGGGRGETPAWNRWLNERGIVVVDADYRLPPPERWRDEVADVESALRWVAGHAVELGVDPTRISLLGHSAGGNLAMLAAHRARPDGNPPVRCVVNIYGPADLTSLWTTSASPRYIRRCLRRYLGGTPAEVPDRFVAVSPLHHVAAGGPPTLTVVGTSDRLIPADQARALAAVLGEAGIECETVLLPATDHAFDVNWGGFATQVARAAVASFLDRHG